ncbi:DUF1549 domain-containing protein [Lignipirellula cremea]|uniref:Planctomycete cytochrome C n=1 Tax=Lignipirellula cremea TaxID=2528010 RepID=A0A518DL65_9BACT|nr:DUF1549 domain-containing protein [Lignipirellula cremea]QDU92578.1 hypothetical protein Pla8534_03260 [Lignipirellula cremea]
MIPLFLLTLSLAAPPGFAADIEPVLTRAGCNAGACHGAAAGRGGFRLSLYGSRPADDYHAIVRELAGRRINLAAPEQSLVVRKPTLELQHEGGLRLDDPGRDLLLAWIAAGAPLGEPPHITQLRVQPPQALLAVDTPLALRVFATFAPTTGDSSAAEEREVTRWATFTPADPQGVVLQGKTPVVMVRRPGRHLVTVRYLQHTIALELLSPWEKQDEPLPAVRTGYLDDLVNERLAQMNLSPSPVADDGVFLRRVTLDLTGRLPAPAETLAFLASKASDKREALVDRLLASEAFTVHWTHRLARQLRLQVPAGDAAAATVYYRWLEQQVRTDVGWDRIARSLVTAAGDTHTIGPATFHRNSADARAEAEQVSETLLGMRLRCANCHDHPFDRWTQDDYHGLAAVFADLQRGREVRPGARSAVIHPATGQPAPPRLPGSAEPLAADASGPELRAEFARWLTSEANPRFAAAQVNRVWQACFGRGLVEPVDDLRVANPATHPELLDRLSADFIADGYRLRPLLRRICTSATYARSAQPLSGNQHDSLYYSHAVERPLAAAQLADALADVTGAANVFPATGTDRAGELIDPATPSLMLDALGRCEIGACETTSSTGPSTRGLATMLHLINGPTINEKLASPAGWLQQQLAAGAPAETLLADLYLRAFCRRPTIKERRFWRQQLSDSDTREEQSSLLQDIAWSLLVSREFTTNH